MQVYIQFDATGEWIKVNGALGEGAKRSYYLPIIPRRADHYRLRLDGTGGCRVYSMVREYYDGSALKSQKGAAVNRVKRRAHHALQLQRLSERRYIIRPAG